MEANKKLEEKSAENVAQQSDAALASKQRLLPSPNYAYFEAEGLPRLFH